jgi:chemotaxis protein histidine kinase CheA
LRPQDFAAATAGQRQLLRKRLDTIFRCVHNIKGNAALIKFSYFQKRTEDFESKLMELRNRTTLGGDDFLSVVFAQSEMCADVEELEALRGKFAETAKRSGARSNGAAITVSLTNGASGSHPDDVVVAISALARSIAAKLGKEVRVDATGFDTRALDEHQRRAVKDALVQLTRNSLTHGVEMPGARSAAGKNPCATLTIRPVNDGPGQFGFTFRDDGRGFDTERIRNRAIAQGMLSGQDENSYRDDAKVVRLIFEPGFSTVDQVTEESGRGMGMSVIKHRIVDDCRGRISVNSEPGRFCELKISVPVKQLAHV